MEGNTTQKVAILQLSNSEADSRRIKKITLVHLPAGEMKMLSHTELYNLLQIQKDNPYVEINDRFWKSRTNRK